MVNREHEDVDSVSAVNEHEAARTVGAQLRAQRESAGLSLNEIAARTRVPIRHLEAIESSDYSALPGSTYTIGFTKSYAKALGLDEMLIATELRDELEQGGYHGMVVRAPAYEPADPARVPPRWLAWSAAALAVALVAVYFVWRSFALSPEISPTEPAKTLAEAAIKDKPKLDSTAAIDPSGEVVISAREAVWIRIYDAEDKRLFEKEMQPGEQFTVPANANNPMIVTGRPQVLDVTIGGKPVPALGTGERSITGVGVSAAALLARATATPTSSSDSTVQSDTVLPAAQAPR